MTSEFEKKLDLYLEREALLRKVIGKFLGEKDAFLNRTGYESQRMWADEESYWKAYLETIKKGQETEHKNS